MGRSYPDPLKNKLYLGCLFFLEIGCFSVSSGLHAQPVGTALSISQQREQAVQLAKRGKLQQAIRVLQRLHQQSPKDFKVTADLIVLLRQAGKNQAITALTRQGQLHQQALQLPAYARQAWIGGLRDSQQPQLAYQVAQQVAGQGSSVWLEPLYYATLAAEAGQSRAVETILQRMKPTSLHTAEHYAQLAYIYRLIGDEQKALFNADQALRIQPAQPLALAQQQHLMRQHAVKLASQQLFEPALIQLKQLHQQYPENVKVTADLMVVLRQAGRNAELVQLGRQEHLTATLQAIPSYAYQSWLDALRDQKQFQAAFELAGQINDQAEKQSGHTSPIDPWYYATLAAEAGQTQVVRQLIPLLQQGQLSADHYARLAYIQRLAGFSAQAVVSSQRALALNPQQRLALEQQFVALSNLNQTEAAYQLALQHPDIFSASTVWPVKADWLSQNLQAALKQKDVLEAQGEYPQARQLIDQNILALRQALDQLDKSSEQYPPLLNDYLYTLRINERFPELIEQYQQLSVSEQFQLQPYAKRAVADAYLALKQPQTAHEIYQYLLTELPQPDAELFIADYYALLEQEKYPQASALLQRLDQQFPALTTAMASVDTEAQKTRVRVEQVLALDAAYRNRLDLAAPKLEQLVQHNPDNIDLANDYATILNWRGLPQASDQVVQQAYEKGPYSVALDLTTISNARDLQDTPRWQAALNKAVQKTPHNIGVIKAQQQWHDRQRVTLQSELNIGQSKADEQTLSGVNGSREREWHTRINSPWLDSQMVGSWRLFADHQDRWADFEPTHLRDQRFGLGAEWQQDRKSAWVLIHQQINTPSSQNSGDQTGVSAGWGHWLNDHWRYRLGYDHNSAQIPLRALEAGLDANGYQAGVDWRQHESRSASFGYQALDISDGNLRQSLSAVFNQRLFANQQHITTGGLEAFYEANSQPGGSYFNPDHTLSYGINLQHDWMTWRGDEQQSFNQHFELGTGMTQQADFSSKSYVNALYQHEWQLSRTWQINYGVGWGSQVYDGNREHRTYGVLGLSGAF